MKEGWKNLKFKEVCYSISDGDWIEKKNQSSSGIRLIQTGNIGVGKFIPKDDSQKFITADTFKRLRCSEIFEGDILISRLPNPLGRSCILPKLETRCITAVDCSILKIKGDVILPHYFIYYTQSNGYFSKIDSESSGTTRARITRKKLEETVIPVPSLDEQRSIVSRLDAAFAGIDALKANAERQLAEARALFNRALTEEMTPKEGWTMPTIRDLSILITKGASPKWQGNTYVNSGGILFVTSENVREGFLEFNPPKYVDTSFNQRQRRSILKKDDVLVNIVGASIGRAAVFNLDVDDANINQAVCLVRFNKEKLLPKYLCLFLNSEIASKQYLLMVKDAARANLSLENIGDLKIGLPSITTQHSIVTRLDTLSENVRKLEEVQRKTLVECEALKQAMLKEVFE